MFPVEFRVKYQEQEAAQEEARTTIMKSIFTFLHFLCIILFAISAFFTGLANTDIRLWNMSLHCNDPTFNQIMTPVDRTWPVLTIAMISFIIFFMLSVDVCVGDSASHYFRNIMNYGMGLLLSWNVTFVLQNMVSYPKPSFYKEVALDCFYCNRSCVDASQFLVPDRQLDKLDMDSRTSFPCYIIAACAYVTTFLFGMFSYMDKNRRFAAKLVALLAPASVTMVYGWYFWQQHEHHPQDVIAGALIGGFVGFYIIRDMFRVEKKFEDIMAEFTNFLIGKQIDLVAVNNSLEIPNSGRYTINFCTHDGFIEEEEGEPRVDDFPPAYASIA